MQDETEGRRQDESWQQTLQVTCPDQSRPEESAKDILQRLAGILSVPAHIARRLKSQVWGLAPVIPAAQEAEAGGFLEPRNLRLQ